MQPIRSPRTPRLSPPQARPCPTGIELGLVREGVLPVCARALDGRIGVARVPVHAVCSVHGGRRPLVGVELLGLRIDDFVGRALEVFHLPAHRIVFDRLLALLLRLGAGGQGEKKAGQNEREDGEKYVFHV